MRRPLVTGLAALIAAGMVVLSACGSDAARTGGQGGSIPGTWDLQRYSSAGVMSALPDGLTTQITFASGHVSGKAAINGYRGPFTADGATGALSIGPVISTQMGGDPKAMAAESDYLRALEAAASYTAGAGALTIFAESGETLLVYAESDATIAGSWEVTGYNNGKEAVVSLIAGSAVTADFGEDGTLSGDSGVNRYRTTYEVTGGAGISIPQPAGTLMAGPPDLMEQERLYLAALASAETFTLRGDQLTLRDSSDAIAVTLTRS